MERFIGGFFGLFIGDAMGVPVEFCSREELVKNPITNMKGFGSHDVPAGAWSDDTSMTIALVDSIVEKGEIDYTDIMDKFHDWVMFGKYTPTGKMFDIGTTCLQAISNYAKGGEPLECGLDDEFSNGNGSLMRILPIVFYCKAKELNDEEIAKLVDEVSSLTHAHEVSRLGCYIYVKYMLSILDGMDKVEAYEKLREEDFSRYSEESLAKYSRILEADITELELDDIKSTGYIVDTLEAALWVFLKTDTFSQAIIGSVNLGDDTDTVGAVCGSIAGTYYGGDAIPAAWYVILMKKEYLKSLVTKYKEMLEL